MKTKTMKTNTCETRFVDLGLPSGTLWAADNLPGRMTWEETEKCRNNLPTFGQFKELMVNCTKETMVSDVPGEESRTVLTGPNGNTISFPDTGKVMGGGRYWIAGEDGQARVEISTLTKFLDHKLEPKDRAGFEQLVRLVSDAKA
jgi:hypothetical protein